MKNYKTKTYKSSCVKRNFKTKPQAEDGLEMLKILNQSKGQEDKNKYLHVYECGECQAWHIGHINHRNRNRK